MKSCLPYATGTLVEIRKLSASEAPIVAAGAWEDWVFGRKDNPCSLPVNYVMLGVLKRPVRVGGRIDLHRTHRNGVAIEGDFVSSPVIAISDDALVETYNSIYQVTPVDVEEFK